MTPFPHHPSKSGAALCLHVSFQFWTVYVRQGLCHIPIFCHISHPSSHWTAGSFFKGDMQFNKVETNITLLFCILTQGRKKKSLPKELPSIKEEGREALYAKRKRKISLARQTDIASTCSTQETRSAPTQLFERGSNLKGAPSLRLCALLYRAGDKKSLIDRRIATAKRDHILMHQYYTQEWTPSFSYWVLSISPLKSVCTYLC